MAPSTGSGLADGAAAGGFLCKDGGSCGGAGRFDHQNAVPAPIPNRTMKIKLRRIMGQKVGATGCQGKQLLFLLHFHNTVSQGLAFIEQIEKKTGSAIPL